MRDFALVFTAIVTPDHGALVVTFPDAPGCVTQVDHEEHLLSMATDALAGWLDASLDAGDVMPAPGGMRRAPRGSRSIDVPVVPTAIALRVLLRRARANEGLSQSALAQRLGVSAYAVRAVDRSGARPTQAMMNRIAAALCQAPVVGAVCEGEGADFVRRRGRRARG